METTRAALPLQLGEAPTQTITLVRPSIVDDQHPSPIYRWADIDAQVAHLQATDAPSSGGSAGVSWQTTGIVTGVALAFAGGAIAAVDQSHPAYQSQFELTVAPSRHTTPQPLASPTVSPTVEAVQSVPEMSVTDIQTQIQILKSRMLLIPVVEQLQRRNTDLSYDDLVANLSIEPLGQNTLIVRYRHDTPDVAQTVVNELAASYQVYSQDCRLEACLGLKYVDSQIPLIQDRIQTTRADLQQLQERLGAANAERQAQVLSARETDLFRQKLELEETLAATRQQYATLLERLAISAPTAPANALDQSIPFDILEQNPQYQLLLRQLKTIDQQIAIAYSQLSPTKVSLVALQEQYATTLDQLRQAVQSSTDGLELTFQDGAADVAIQEPIYRELIAEAIATAHQLQVLEIRQQSIQQIEAGLNQQTRRLATLLKQQQRLQRDLATNTRILQEYIDRREAFQTQSDQEYVLWEIETPPALANDADDPSQSLATTLLPVSLGLGAGISIVVGLTSSPSNPNGYAERFLRSP